MDTTFPFARWFRSSHQVAAAYCWLSVMHVTKNHVALELMLNNPVRNELRNLRRERTIVRRLLSDHRNQVFRHRPRIGPRLGARFGDELLDVPAISASGIIIGKAS
jgi:hypothetical protein